MSRSVSAVAEATVDAMHPRLAEEWSDIRELHPSATHQLQPERLEVVLDLDAAYSSAETPVAVLIPAGYRTAGPDGFLVPVGLAFADGSALPASDASGVGMPGWSLVSFHYTDANGASTWRPTADFRVGDNLIGYLSSIEHFIAHRCS
jgi:hypothetical protein